MKIFCTLKIIELTTPFLCNVRGGNFPPIQVKTFESIRGAIADLPVAWFEIHPLFDGQEFDVAILGLKSYIQRNIFLHPICLPKWSKIDLEGKATIDRLYRSTQWEKYQMLYSLKVRWMITVTHYSKSSFFVQNSTLISREKC